MLSAIGGVSVKVRGGPPRECQRRLELLRHEISTAAQSAQAFANAPLAASVPPFRFCGALSLPPIVDLRVVGDDEVDVEFPAAAVAAGWVHDEMAAAARGAHGLPLTTDGDIALQLAVVATTSPPPPAFAEEAAWILLCTVGGALTLVHGCGLSLGGRTGPSHVLWSPGAGTAHECRFFLPLPSEVDISRSALLDLQRGDIAGLAAAIRWLTSAAGTPKLSAELEFLVAKMESAACPTASQLINFQAVRLRCETWMLRRAIAHGIGASGGAAVTRSPSQMVTETPPRSPVPTRSRDVSLASSSPPHAKRSQIAAQAASASTPPSSPPSPGASAVAVDHDECEIVEMTEECVTAAAASSPQELRQLHDLCSPVRHRSSGSITTEAESVGGSSKRTRSPRHCTADRAANDAWLDSRLDDLSTMRAELSRIGEARTPARDRLAAAELLNQLRHRTQVN